MLRTQSQRPKRAVWSAPALALVLALALVGSAFAQVPTGTITGQVTDDSGDPLPGITVTAESESVQGSRTTITDGNGSYKFGFLPAGLYEFSYTLEGFSTALKEVRVNAGQNVRIDDVAMRVSDVTEEIVVTGNLETVTSAGSVTTTIGQSDLEKLAVARNITQAVDLIPGVHRTGPTRSGERQGNISISGSMSFENLYTVNGVVINENLRGQPLDLFIEDAIQEHTVSTGSVSAEFGRFTGGTVNVLTKSGGNQFHGSLRSNLTNQDWESATRFTTAQEDKVNETYEATLGGRILTDKLWFFAAARDLERTRTETTPRTFLNYQEVRDQQRLEGKLTANLTQSHNLVASYFEIDDETQGDTFGDVIELSALSNRTDPNDLMAVNYNGVFSSNFFVEAQYSERNLDNGVGNGGPRDIITGATWETVIDDSTFGAPPFCGECETEQRNNENFLIKGSYFFSSDRVGTHDITFGYDTFNDVAFDVNHQAGNDFRLAADTVLIDDNTGQVFPVMDPNGSSWVAAWPVFGLDRVRSTDFTTNSFFVNDRWQLNDKWAFNIGVRYDENDGQDAGGATTVDDSKVSPRLSVSYDVKGDGDLLFNASAGTYVAAIANNIADSASTGGAIGRAILFWGGPPINTDAGCLARGDCIGTPEATEIVMNWWLDTTGFNPITDAPENIATIPGALFLSIPGTESNQIVPDTLKSPSADELTFGVTKRLGNKGVVRADLVWREWEDFYSDRINLQTGQVPVQGVPLDLKEIGNFGNDFLEREYTGLHVNARYRLLDRLTLSAAYALSELEGNINGETAPNGPIGVDPNEYPEYKAYPQWNPSGRLGSDQTHKLRAWGIYDAIVGDRHNLTVSLLQSFNSGTPYGALGSVDPSLFVNNPGYVSPPTNANYYFTARDAFETDDITQTDLALNYTFRVARGFEIFVQPEVLNIFDEDGALSVVTRINDSTTGGSSLSTFNPFTETPTEGVHWTKDPAFGQPEGELDLQRPRTFRVSVGFRF